MNVPVLVELDSICPFVSGLFHLTCLQDSFHVIACIRSSFLFMTDISCVHIYIYLLWLILHCVYIYIYVYICSLFIQSYVSEQSSSHLLTVVNNVMSIGIKVWVLVFNPVETKLFEELYQSVFRNICILHSYQQCTGVPVFHILPYTCSVLFFKNSSHGYEVELIHS